MIKKKILKKIDESKVSNKEEIKTNATELFTSLQSLKDSLDSNKDTKDKIISALIKNINIENPSKKYRQIKDH